MAHIDPEPRSVPNDLPHVADAVITDLKVRKDMGITKYGTALQPLNSRDPMVDLYQELLDACQYAKQVLMEREMPIDKILAENRRLFVIILQQQEEIGRLKNQLRGYMNAGTK